MSGDLWKYCTDEQCKNFLLSMKLTGNIRLSDEKCLALYTGFPITQRTTTPCEKSQKEPADSVYFTSRIRF